MHTKVERDSEQLECSSCKRKGERRSMRGHQKGLPKCAVCYQRDLRERKGRPAYRPKIYQYGGEV